MKNECEKQVRFSLKKKKRKEINMSYKFFYFILSGVGSVGDQDLVCLCYLLTSLLPHFPFRSQEVKPNLQSI